MGTRSVVTGGAGFIGSHIVDRLVANGSQVTVLDDLSTGRRDNVRPGVALVELDVAAMETSNIIAEIAPTVVVHCAAQASVSASMADPAKDIQSNIVGTLQVLRGAADAGATMFVYLTTGGALYGESDQLPTPESASTRPLSPYGLSKATAEAYLALLAPPGLGVTVLRLANVFGPRQRSDGEGGVVSIFLDRMFRREPVQIYGDGQQTRDFVYVADVVDAVVAAIERKAVVTVNIGTGIGTTVNRLFELAAESTTYRLAPVYLPGRHGEVRHSRLDVTAARELLGWTPQTELRTGLKLTASSLERLP